MAFISAMSKLLGMLILRTSYLFLVILFLIEWPLPDADGDLMILHYLVPGERPEVDAGLVVADHGQELPVRVARVHVH